MAASPSSRSASPVGPPPVGAGEQPPAYSPADTTGEFNERPVCQNPDCGRKRTRVASLESQANGLQEEIKELTGAQTGLTERLVQVEAERDATNAALLEGHVIATEELEALQATHTALTTELEGAVRNLRFHRDTSSTSATKNRELTEAAGKTSREIRQLQSIIRTLKGEKTDQADEIRELNRDAGQNDRSIKRLAKSNKKLKGQIAKLKALQTYFVIVKALLRRSLSTLKTMLQATYLVPMTIMYAAYHYEFLNVPDWVVPTLTQKLHEYSTQLANTSIATSYVNPATAKFRSIEAYYTIVTACIALWVFGQCMHYATASGRRR